MKQVVTLALVGLLGSGSGCSTLLVNGPGAPSQLEPECTSHNLFPGIDTALTVMFALSAVAMFAVSGSDEVDDEARTAFQIGGVLYGASAVGLGVSASNGFNKTRRCRAAREAWRARFQPYPYPQPQPYYPYPPQQPVYPTQPVYPQGPPQPVYPQGPPQPVPPPQSTSPYLPPPG